MFVVWAMGIAHECLSLMNNIIISPCLMWGGGLQNYITVLLFNSYSIGDNIM